MKRTLELQEVKNGEQRLAEWWERRESPTARGPPCHSKDNEKTLKGVKQGVLRFHVEASG